MVLGGIVRRPWALSCVVVVALATPVAALGFSRPTKVQVAPHAFSSCASLVGYAQAHFSQTHGYPEPAIGSVATSTSTAPSAAHGSTSSSASSTGSSPAAPSTSTPYSTTNNQEQGVDEPDIAKTDGSTIFTLSGNKLIAVAVGSKTPQIAGTLDLSAGSSPNLSQSQLLMRGNRLIVISGSSPILYPQPLGGAAVPSSIMASPYYRYGAQTLLTEVDISNPSAMKVTQTMTIDGTFVDARQSGTSARIVISSAPYAIAKPLMATASKGWVPSWTFHDRRSGRRFVRQVSTCQQIRRPAQFSGVGMVNIVTVNFDRGLGAAHSDSLMADAQIVYGSQSSLYLATQKWINPELSVGQLPSSQVTVIDRFDVSNPDTTTLVSSGEVPGYLLNQFSLSESGSYLRVASTSRPIWWGAMTGGALPVSQSYVTVLSTAGPVMAPVGQVSGLGQGEQIYSVRFVDDTAYVVTYKQVDPLYTIDLSTPTAPRVAGQLDLEGYSAYLHPLGNGLLLGIGVDVSTNNEPSGAQLELFDVSNAAAPKLLAKTSLGTGSSTQVAYDHHAFLYWPATNLAVLPVQIWGMTTIAPPPGGTVSPVTPFVGAIGYRVTSSGISEVGRIVHDTLAGATQPPAILRSLVIGDQLYTISDQGVMASSLDTLARQAYVAFPIA